MRNIVTTARFERRLVRFSKQHPKLKGLIAEMMRTIARGDSKVRVHALHGPMKGTYASRILQQYRIVFAFESEAVVFIDIGSHDEVY